MQPNKQNDTVLCNVRPDEAGTNIYYCCLCQKDYKFWPWFRVHMKSKHNYEAIICSKCPSMFEDMGQRMLHNNQNHLKMRVNCKTTVMTTKKVMLKCNLCNYETPNPGTLKSHIRGHTGEKPFVCGVCRKGFTQKSNMLTHYRKHFEITNNKVFNCDDCNEFYASAYCLQKHLASTIHQIIVSLNWFHEQKRDGKKYLQCQGCDEYSTGYAKELLSHASKCTSSSPAQCTECNQLLELDMHNLCEHMHQHQDKILCCWVCENKLDLYKPFSTRHQLSVHIGAHHPEAVCKSSVCRYCETIFDNHNEMIKHVFEMHNEQRNKHISNEKCGKILCEFEGQKCGFATNSLHMLDKHLRTDHDYLQNAEFGTQMLVAEVLPKEKIGRPRIMTNLVDVLTLQPPSEAATRDRKHKRNTYASDETAHLVKIQKILERESD